MCCEASVMPTTWLPLQNEAGQSTRDTIVVSSRLSPVKTNPLNKGCACGADTTSSGYGALIVWSFFFLFFFLYYSCTYSPAHAETGMGERGEQELHDLV